MTSYSRCDKQNNRGKNGYSGYRGYSTCLYVAKGYPHG